MGDPLAPKAKPEVRMGGAGERDKSHQKAGLIRWACSDNTRQGKRQPGSLTL